MRITNIKTFEDLRGVEIEQWLKAAREQGVLSASGFDQAGIEGAAGLLYPDSLQQVGPDSLLLICLQLNGYPFCVIKNKASKAQTDS